MASGKKVPAECSVVQEWLSEDKLMLLECWMRDGYTYDDIANRIGISPNTIGRWKKEYPEIRKALAKGKEIVDYKVENALLKSALGYPTKEVKVTTTMRYGKVIETVKEVTESEQAPNITAIQVWLYNRCKDKWKRNRDNIIDVNEEDTQIQVTVTRANKSEGNNNNNETKSANTSVEDEEWQAEVGKTITLRNKTKEEKAQDKKKAQAKSADTKVEMEDEDLDAWPEDWEDEE